MNLIGLIEYFRSGGDYEIFLKEYSLDIDSEVIEIYMVKPFSLNANITFFEIEKTNGKIEYEVNGIKYHNLFDFYYFLDVMGDVKNKSYDELSNEKLAKILLDYAVEDA